MAQVVIIGGGHNGLTAAAYLAKAGRKVVVLEARERCGGLAAEESFGDGFRVPGLLHDSRSVRPQVVAELGLAKHGLRRQQPPRICLPRRQGEPLWLSADKLEGSIGDADIKGYAALKAFIAKLRPVLQTLLNRPPVGPDTSLWPLLSTGASLRRLGARDMLELMRVAPMCVADFTRDQFKDERLSAALALAAVKSSWMGPWSAGSTASFLLREGLAEDEVVGGGAALTAALRQAAEGFGAEVRTGSPVTAIVMARRKVKQVVLESGESLDARWVLASCDPQQTFVKLIGAQRLPVALAADMRVWRARGTTAKLHLAIEGGLQLADGSEVEALRSGETLDEIEKAFDAIKYGRFSERPVLDVRVPSMRDSSLCPEGTQVLSIMVSYAPYALRGGWTEDAKAALSRAAIDALAEYCPRVPEQIIATELLTPADIESRYRLSGGHLFHGEHAPDQLLFMRPSADCGSYRTPIEGLFVGGAGSHPGGGLSCMPGALAAAALLQTS